jgi:hypothetical protein
MGMLGNGTPGDMGQDDSIGESDFDGESGLGGMDPTTGMANIGSWATAKDPNRTMSQVLGLFSKQDDPTVSMAKAYGPKGKGYAYSDSFNFDKNVEQHVNFIVDLMDKQFFDKYSRQFAHLSKTKGKLNFGLKDSKSVYDAMTEDEKEAMKEDAKASTFGILSGIPDNIKDDVAMGVNVTVANMISDDKRSYGPKADTKAIPDYFNLTKHKGFWGKAKTIKDNANWMAYSYISDLDATIANMLGEEPGTQSDVTAMEGGESNQ